MADIFISYAREDRAVAEKLAAVMEEEGWTVWWDRKVRIGQSFANVIEHELERSRCVVVIWSAVSVVSEWVSAEAAEGARRGVLVPLLLGEVRPPLEFRRLQTAPIDRALRDRSGLAECISAIKTVLNDGSAVGSEAVAGSPALQARAGSVVARSRIYRNAVVALLLVSAMAILSWQKWASPTARQPPRRASPLMAPPSSTAAHNLPTVESQGLATSVAATTTAANSTAPFTVQDLIGTWSGRLHTDDPAEKPHLLLRLAVTPTPDHLSGELEDSAIPIGGSSTTTVVVTPGAGNLSMHFQDRQIVDDEGNPVRQGHQFVDSRFTIRRSDDQAFELIQDDGVAAYTFTRDSPKR